MSNDEPTKLTDEENILVAQSVEHALESCRDYADVVRLKHAHTKKLFVQQFENEKDLYSTLQELTAFYDAVLKHLFRSLCVEMNLSCDNGGVAVYALGKLGSFEVNFDSDFDIIFMRAPYVSEPDRAKWEALVQKFNQMLASETAYGHLPRLDLELRPHGNAGMLLPNLEQAQHYYWNSSDLWHRLGWLRGRFLTGDRSLEKVTNEWLPKYIYPRLLDYRLPEQLGILHEKIRKLSEHDHDAAGWKVKYGAGGIREIEFCVHGLVLLHGGRRPDGRSGNIFEGIDYLEKHELKDDESCDVLRRIYSALRRLEHVAQWYEKHRTYVLPDRLVGHKFVKSALATSNFQSLAELFHAGALFFQKSQSTTSPPNPVVDKKINAEIDELLKPYMNEKLTQKWTLEARLRWQKLVPLLLLSLEEFEHPEMALRKFLTWVDALKIRGGYFHLLLENPLLLRKLLRILSLDNDLLNDWLVHPRCIENLLLGQWDGRSSFQQYWDEWKRELSVPAERTDNEELFDQLRECRTTFALEIAQRYFSHADEWRALQVTWNHVSDVVVREILIALSRAMESFKVSNKVTMSWIILGSHGGLTADIESDLDLMVVVSDESESHMDELLRMCQKVVSVITTRTPKGALYPVDWRLAPFAGRSPMIVTRSYFLKYATTQGRLWEWLSWFRGREIAVIKKGPKIDVKSDWYRVEVLVPLHKILTSGAKKFSQSDVEQLLRTFEEHRKKPGAEKWDACGLIETETLARLRSWEKKTLDENLDFDSTCQREFKGELAQYASQLLKESWSSRVFGTPEVKTKNIFSLADELKKSRLIS